MNPSNKDLNAQYAAMVEAGTFLDDPPPTFTCPCCGGPAKWRFRSTGACLKVVCPDCGFDDDAWPPAMPQILWKALYHRQRAREHDDRYWLAKWAWKAQVEGEREAWRVAAYLLD